MKLEKMIEQCLDRWRAYNSTCGLLEDERIRSVTPEQFALVYWFLKFEGEFYELAKEMRNGTQ
jgi:hypothetical protein